MKKQLRAAVVGMLVLGTVSLQAQTSTTAKPKTTHKRVIKKKAPVESATEREIRELREQMQSQQAQIDSLKQQNAEKDAKLATASQDAQAANAAAAQASSQAAGVSSSVQENKDAVTTLNSNLNDLKIANVGLAQTISDTKKDLSEKIDDPLAIRYKGITITPVAFFALESVYRSRSINSDINTPFNATPYPGAAQADTSEFNVSGRQSRLGGLFEGNTGPFKLSGYFEADFLSGGTTSNSNQSNSYTLRQRQFWGQIATQRGFALTGGQMWSLVTETKKGTDNRTENLPMTIDAQYHVGFSWARQAALRVQQKIGIATVAFSLENAQNIFSATNPNSNFFFGNAGTGGGLYNATANYSNNVAPDVIVKAAFDPKIGHYEIGGLARFFRDRYYPGVDATPTTGAAGATNDTKTGGGFFANARVPVTHFADVGVHTLVGTGVGRYGTSTLPDTTVHPDGTLATIKSYQGLFSLELHPVKKVDLFGYAGGEYAQRTAYLNLTGPNAGKLTGYAPITSSNAGCNIELPPTGNSGYNPATPGNCLGATRAVIQGTAGFTYRFYNSPRFGRLQYQVQYSYLTREAWTGVGGAPKATNNMVFTGMRYYIP
jgi:multidrug efflux pump subunit AcrA (membrane-fusion protein)